MATVRECPDIAGVLIASPRVFEDERGMFVESFRQEWLPPNAPPMVQGNRADRQSRCIVGLHFHRKQADYWYVPAGRVFVALYDLRESSSTRNHAFTVEMGPQNHFGLYIPPGIAHGFCTLIDSTITYLVDHYYDPEDELGIAWDDPSLGIKWPIASPIVSQRDTNNPKRSEVHVP